MRILVKIGGAQLAQPETRATFARSVMSAHAEGHELVLVHGGGDQVHALANRLGLRSTKVDGLRVTDAPMADVALAVLSGTVNRTLVAALEAAGVRAVGLTGADGGLFAVKRHAPGGRDLGYVGEVCSVDTTVAEALLCAGATPVIAPMAPLALGQPGARDRLYNVNADSVAGPLATALEADCVLFLTDMPAVLDTQGEPLVSLNPDQAEALRASGALGGGMLPKLDAAFAAASARPQALVRIAPSAGPEAVLTALLEGVGTTLLTGTAVHG